MRILYASFDVVPAPKGASTHITQFIEALAEVYPNPTLLTVGPTPSRPESRYHGARHVRIRLPEGNFLAQTLFFRDIIADHLRQERYDVVHFRSIWEGLPAVYAQTRGGFRTVYEVNGLPSLELPYHFPALRHHPRLLERLAEQERECLQAATAVITPSAVTQRYLLHQSVPPERIAVIPNGVDPRVFCPASPEVGGLAGWRVGSAEDGELVSWRVGEEQFTSEIRNPKSEIRRTHQPTNPPAHQPTNSSGDRPLRLLYVGTLAPWQGLDVLLEAVEKVRRDIPLEVWFLSPIRRPWRKALEKQTRKLGLEGCVQFLPPRDAVGVAAVIQAADLCLAPLADTPRNRVQGCSPIKLFEYMACRKPIIAARLPVVQEILTDGEDALLYRPDDPRHLRNAILRLAADPDLRERLAARAYEKVLHHYTWAHAHARLLRVYASLAMDRTNPAA